MTTTRKLQLQLDEVDMIAYVGKSEPVCSFHYDDSIASNENVERARAIVRHVNIHDELLGAAELALRELREFYVDEHSQAIMELKAAIANATGRAP